MHCVDVNVLLDAIISTSANHDPARQVLDRLRRHPEGLGLFSVVISGFIRISTSRKVLREPLDIRSAIGVVDVLTSSPFVHVINPGRGHWPIFRSLLDSNRPRSHDVTDAWLAAAALEINATWVSFDRGFARFAGLRWIDPSSEVVE